MKSPIIRGALAALLLFAAAPGAAPAHAQAQQPSPQQAPEIDDAKLQTFAEAYLAVGEVRMEMQQELQATQDEDEAARIQQEANAEMESVLEDHGFTVQEYQQITQVLNADPEQRQEFQQVIQELREGPSSPQLQL